MQRRRWILLVIGGLLLLTSIASLIASLFRSAGPKDFQSFIWCPLSGLVIGVASIVVGQRLAPPPDVDQLKSEGNVKGLRKALKYKKDDGVREAAAKALGEIGGGDALEPLLAALEDEVSAVRGEAAQALGHIGDPRAIDRLTAALGDTDVRKSAAEALEQLGAPSVEALVGRLEDEDPEARTIAEETLGRIGDDRAVQPLIARLGDDVVSVRRAAADALGAIGNRDAVEPLIDALEQDVVSVREEAVQALGNLGDPLAVDWLIAALKDKELRMSATEALGKVEHSGAVGALIAMLEDTQYMVRRAAAHALGKIADQQAVPPLVVALGDLSTPVGMEAANALVTIGPPAIQPLIAALADADRKHSVREGAARVLRKIYRSGQLGQEHKQAILSRHSEIVALTKRHVDRAQKGTHVDKGTKMTWAGASDCVTPHTDRPRHIDRFESVPL
jgi:HEAT repeat protein